MSQNCKTNHASRMLSVVAGMLVALLLLLSPVAAHAQNYAGSVRGAVTDPSGAAVVGATVTLRDVGTNASSQATTTELGAYSFPAVSVGVYEVIVKAGSFKEFLARNVEVHVSTATEVDAKLELGASNEVVTVEASDIQVQTTTADVGAVIEGTQVRELPLNGRNFMELTQLQPGVSANNGFQSRGKGLEGGSDFSVHGTPSTAKPPAPSSASPRGLEKTSSTAVCSMKDATISWTLQASSTTNTALPSLRFAAMTGDITSPDRSRRTSSSSGGTRNGIAIFVATSSPLARPLLRSALAISAPT